MNKGIAIIQTWGTNSQTKYLDEDVGHASIELRLPATPENDNLIAQYCDQIPYIPHHIENEKNKDGTEQEIYVVHFSFIPNELNVIEPFHLSPTYQEDALYAGNIHPDPLFTSCTLTEKGCALNPNTIEGRYIENQKALADCDDLLNATTIIIKKTNKLLKQQTNLDPKHPNYKIILDLVERLNRQLPQEQKISVEPFNELSERVDYIRHKLTDQLLELRNQNNQFTNSEAFNKDEYLFYGRPYDDQIELSIGSKKNELNAACMLEQMRKIVSSDTDSHTHNGASTVLSILKAGRKGQTFELPFLKNFQATPTPQMIYTTAMELKNKTRLENSAEIIQEKTPTSLKSASHQEALIIGLLATAGLVIGTGIGITLVATGVFAPLGVGVLGLVAVAGTIGGGLALISGSLGLSITKSKAPATIEAPPKNRGISEPSSYLVVNKLMQLDAKAPNPQKNLNHHPLPKTPSVPSMTNKVMSPNNLFFTPKNSPQDNQKTEPSMANNDKRRHSI
ncbi:hypothetical protein Lsan_1875 [Legionella santicrucis]|uniref:Dot/Icm T4SS effector n=1 Tax=Legionella santicrucis TaxID=45074 RepID=A0A0W0YWQ1_9GAMM|nr:hypothetical protein [Legionella santicrucis]KTD61313.1 hypothetical protein Lsan_1875 [Legionella santicrucis]